MKHHIKYNFLAIMFVFSAQAVATEHELCWFFRPSNDLHKYVNIAGGYLAACVGKASSAFFAVQKHIPEEMLFKISEMKAKRVFWDAYDTVPAYKDFVGSPVLFSDIPLMTKATYLKRYPLEKTLKGGALPAVGSIDPAIGARDKTSLVVHDESEINAEQDRMNFVYDVLLGNENYILINTFMATRWSLGVQRDVSQNSADAYETLKVFGTKHKYLIVGDFAFMKSFINNCPFALNNFDVTLLVDGGYMSHALRAYFMSKGVKKILVGYGCADIRYTIGIQDEFAQNLQELCFDNPALKKDLTGSEDGMPYFFYYNPLSDYIEEIDGRLIFTDLDHKRISPRIRYDAGVQGSLLKMSFVKKVLKKHGIHLEATLNLPLMCFSEKAHGVNLNGALLSFDDLQAAILMTPELARCTYRSAYNQVLGVDGQRKLELWVELNDKLSVKRFSVADIESKVHDALTAINPAFKRTVEKGVVKPTLKIFAYGQSPMPAQKKG